MAKRVEENLQHPLAADRVRVDTTSDSKTDHKSSLTENILLAVIERSHGWAAFATSQPSQVWRKNSTH